MTSPFFARGVIAAGLWAMVFWLPPADAMQTPKPRPATKPPARGWVVPRTASGKPDLQGFWTNATVTPLERPQGAKEFLTPEEVAAAERRGNRDEEADADQIRGTEPEPAAGRGADSAAAEASTSRRTRGGGEPTGNYNAIW